MSRTLADIMATELICFQTDTNIHTAIHVLLEKRISGAPVLDARGSLVGILSKKDCLNVLFSTAYHQDRGGPVEDYMSRDVQTLDAGLDLVAAAQYFLNSPFRRFPIMRDGQLVGQVSRHDIVNALAQDLKAG
ncbi:MAG: CBS domain-containing protein [Rhodospirillales bacterium]|nr:CBS domain-containing protein [Rhodospirillales bacterium]